MNQDLDFKSLKVCILAGGDSAERDVSLNSAEAICDGLTQLGHRTSLFDSATVPLEKLATATEIASADVVFIALHGGAGENGAVQRVLENENITFTGSDSAASALAIDKPRTKAIAQELDIPTPKCIEFSASDESSDLPQKILTELGLPLILKPADGGSTVGLTLVREQSQISEGLKLLAKHCKTGMAEEFVSGRELTVAVFDGEPFEVVEIKPNSELYDYHAKYTKGGSEYFCPASVDSSVRARISAYAQSIYRRLGCAGLSRVDYILDENGVTQFLEINTIPGMTDLSLAPMSAKGFGISFTDLLQRALLSASSTKKERR